MKRILCVGDVHANYDWMNRVVLPAAEKHGVDVIVQVGDFGYWPHTKFGDQFLEKLNRELEILAIPLFWIDGNHENHTDLQQLLKREDGFVNTSVDGTVFDNLIYIPRGKRWEWEGISFLGLGGAYSIDRNWRVEYVSWWPEETITYGDAQRAIENGRADVMFTHDSPAKAQVKSAHKSVSYYDETTENRRLLQEVVDAVKPKLLFHGHWHYPIRSFIDSTGTAVYGLDCDEAPAASMAILDLPNLDVEVL